jgi:hypothetical protein
VAYILVTGYQDSQAEKKEIRVKLIKIVSIIGDVVFGMM